MSNLRDHLTYPDLAGTRKLRRYVLAALLLLVLVMALFGWARLQRSQVRAEVFATPRPVSEVEVQPVALPSLTATPEPTPMAGCPTDPEEWTFLDAFPGDNYKRIEPGCVYESLAKTVAWHMLERIGYSKPEATEMLGFDGIPYRRIETIQGLTSLKGPLDLAVTMEWGPHPDYRYWTLDENGNPGMAYALQGCYRAHTVVGNRVESWGSYPVHCVVAVDYSPGWTVHELGEYRYTANWADQPGARVFVLFAYTSEGQWVLVGELADLYVSHDQIGADLAGDREAAAARHGVMVWDANWLFTTYGFAPYPLQEGWQAMTDPAALQPMGEELNQYVEVP
jgi:hypothetical protein